MSDDSDSDGVYVMNRIALVGFIGSAAVGALGAFVLPLFLGGGRVSLVEFREPFMIIMLVEFAAAIGVLYFGMQLYTPGPDAEAAAAGGREE